MLDYNSDSFLLIYQGNLLLLERPDARLTSRIVTHAADQHQIATEKICAGRSAKTALYLMYGELLHGFDMKGIYHG